MIIREQSYPRVGLIGNPSDGYYGKTIAFTFRNFAAEVTLYESPELEILPSIRDHSVFRSIGHLTEDVRMFGYYGGIRLLKASVKKFYEYASASGEKLHDKNFTIRYQSNIPHLVGLAGSSAIITACFRALMKYYGIFIEPSELANIVLAVETEELSLSAGLQDRVAQAYQGLVYMDFEKKHMDEHGAGRYEIMDPGLLPPLYIAYRSELSEVSEIVHNDIKGRFKRGDKEVLDAMTFWSSLTDKVKDCLEKGTTHEELGPLLDSNFDRRAAICAISEGNIEMIEAARSAGCSAKFTGSGGAIVGTYRDDEMFEKLGKVLESKNIVLARPEIALGPEE